MANKDGKFFGARLDPKGAYAMKWVARFVAIGVVAGLGSILFHFLCEAGMRYFLDALAGYRPPAAAGESHRMFEPGVKEPVRWILFLLPAAGGIFSGWLVYTFAPESEGHGTDAAIDAYHNKGGFIRGRVPIIKTLASAITLTTGGSGGREGPIAQIGAGFGSFLATKLKLSDRERRIMLAAGMGAGVGSIFRAPLAGALFAAEVLYRDPDIEGEVVLPAGLSAVVAYCIFCLTYGWGSLFKAPVNFVFRDPAELLPYTILALVVAAAGWVYVKSFYGVTGFFKRLALPNHFKPVIGGLCTGAIGFFFPQTLAFGYGYVQWAISGDPRATIGFLLILAFGKILTTSFSIGSGGSGGVFGPSVVIGGAIGGVVGMIFHQLGWVDQPGAFVIVGMAGFFTGVSNTPISTIIFVSEMTSSYHLLLPSLLVCTVSYLVSRKWTIYVMQPKNPIASAAHAGDFFVDILQTMKVKDLQDSIIQTPGIPEQMNFSAFKKFFAGTKQHYFPVLDEKKRLTGIFSSTDVRSVLFEKHIEPLVIMQDIAISDIITVSPEDDLNSVLKKFTIKNIDAIPVVDVNDPGILLGMLRRREVIAFYNQRVDEMKRTKSQD
ncbi:chloride channel protein [Desulfatibacillum aliphaticivorans]|uniref:chloride channel protein n=1 Tax=Desulfatibacillum aliphaticivorans TaxID=218208 RepID=UPI0004171B3F|nr:chloride channel protein [Desulfatibacillum aliphaticivorans]